jgi:peptidoglycan-associated lipoprotein
MFRKFMFAVPITIMAIGGSTACATKKFVRTSVGEVNDKVDSQGRAIEETQERTRKNEGRIGEVDQRAAAAAQAAQAANDAAVAANTNATNVGTEANGKFEAIDKASKRLVYEVVLSEDQGNFKFGKTVLPDEAKAKLDEMVAQMKQDPKNIYLEIEGYTDNIGAKATNEKIGLERAEAVKRYLYDQYQIPLHKMNVISYGMEKPVAPNKTKAGRAQNRRVVIKVLA